MNKYMNLQVTGLLGRPHPVLVWVLTTQDVVKVQPHLKMLAGDYFCYTYLAYDRGTDPHCCIPARGRTEPATRYQPAILVPVPVPVMLLPVAGLVSGHNLTFQRLIFKPTQSNWL
jgi:hypothetical protein